MAGRDFEPLALSHNAMKMLEAKYLRKDPETGVFETPEEMYHRVASVVASDEQDREKWAYEFERVLRSQEFCASGRVLHDAVPGQTIISNCVVIHPADSIGSFVETIRDAAMMQQRGCGIGIPFQHIRPAGFWNEVAQSPSGGPVAFLRMFADGLRKIQAGAGSGRPGAYMVVCRIDHPDILEFLDAKRTEGVIGNVNMSIMLTDEFMRAVVDHSDEIWYCNWQGQRILPRQITRGPDGEVVDISPCSMTAGELMNELMVHAWSNGEPGCIFIDTAQRADRLPGLGPVECCVPCGEQYLHSGDACNLGSINLSKFASGRELDEERLREVTRIATRFLDNVIDLTASPVPRVQATFRRNRRIGLGIMGLADLLMLMRVPYDSERGREVAGRAMRVIQESALEMSHELAIEKGPFATFDKSVWAQQPDHLMRNAAVTNAAPAGSTSVLCDVSNGVEPHIALVTHRQRTAGGQMEPFIVKPLQTALQEAGVWNAETVARIASRVPLSEIPGIPPELVPVFVTAMDISPEDHVKMQAAIQKFCCNAISKTVNFPKQATVDDVRRVFVTAWSSGCKGITVYRDGSRSGQPIATGADDDKLREMFAGGCRSGMCEL